MAKKIVWSKLASKKFEAVINYLRQEWTEKEVDKFIDATFETLENISETPRMYRQTSKADIHGPLITPHNLVIYEIHSDFIGLITFWDTRQNPKKKRF